MCAVTVQLTRGDLFDGPSDLVTLPCSTVGSYTGLVAEKLQRFQIPHPRAAPLGHVEIHPLEEDAAQVAHYAALATSVAARNSTAEAIRSIGAALGQATRDYIEVSAVNAPLLGAGAGRLKSEVVVTQLRDGFSETAADGAVLTIFVRHKDVYQRLLGLERVTSSQAEPARHAADTGRPLRVLFSYAHGPSTNPWVDAIYAYLRQQGVDARLDRALLRPGADVMQWMSNEVQMADHVLVICDERYVEKVDGHHGGVAWEAMLIQSDMFRLMQKKADSAKYIPIVRTLDEYDGLPGFLGTKLWIHWPDGADRDAKRSELLDALFPRRREPPLGVPG